MELRCSGAPRQHPTTRLVSNPVQPHRCSSPAYHEAAHVHQCQNELAFVAAVEEGEEVNLGEDEAEAEALVAVVARVKLKSQRKRISWT